MTLPPRLERRRRNRIALALFNLIIGLLVFLFVPQFSFPSYVRLQVYLFAVLIILAGVSVLLMTYLRGEIFFGTRTETGGVGYFEDGRLTLISEEISKLKGQIEKATSKLDPVSTEDRTALRLELKSELRGVLASDVVAQIEKKYSEQFTSDAQIAQIRSGFEKTVLRLRQEIAALSRRSNVNLVIGVLTTVVAVGLLAYLVLRSPAVPFAGFADILSHFIPRVSVAIFIEVFSFFFLKLYKSNLEEIKYFQNELTNVDMKVIALEAALLANKNKSSDTIIEQLIRTDRNSSQSSASSSNSLVAVEPKDIGDLLDKIGKILSLGIHR